MNCEECKENVFELIEREATDPAGVHEILSNCPDCRAEFQKMKAALALARELPVEEPSANLDATILELAEARATSATPAESRVVVLDPRHLWGQPLAMAAVALLMVGVGVSTVSFLMRSAEESLTQVQPSADAVVAAADALLAESSEPMVAARRVEAKASSGSRQVGATRKRAREGEPAVGTEKSEVMKLAADETEPQAVAEAAAPAEQDELPARRSAGGQDMAALEAAGDQKPKSVARPDAGSADEVRRCRTRVASFEKRVREEKRFAPTPQDQLEIGLCYQTLGKATEARTWLKRASDHPNTSARAKKALQQLD